MVDHILEMRRLYCFDVKCFNLDTIQIVFKREDMKDFTQFTRFLNILFFFLSLSFYDMF